MAEELLTYDDAARFIGGLADELRGDTSDVMYLHGLEQTMAIARDHLTSMDCNPDDKAHARAAFCGSMMFMLLQANVSPINPQCVVLADALKTLTTTEPVPADVWASLAARLEPPRKRKVKQFLTALLRQL